MLNVVKKTSLVTAVGFVLSILAGNALADKPHWADGKQQHQYESKQDKKYRKAQEKREKAYKKKHDDKRYEKKYDSRRRHDYSHRFHHKDRQLIYSYFGKQYNKGTCPPGLAKKHNGCLPPGQYKKWHRGQPLSKQVRYYELPRELRQQLSRLDGDYRYVRVDNDVLLLDLATSIVVDAIENILR